MLDTIFYLAAKIEKQTYALLRQFLANIEYIIRNSCDYNKHDVNKKKMKYSLSMKNFQQKYLKK